MKVTVLVRAYLEEMRPAAVLQEDHDWPEGVETTSAGGLVLRADNQTVNGRPCPRVRFYAPGTWIRCDVNTPRAPE